ncbi:LOW QUALITY PROTEIN: phosphoglycerate mutase-like protein 1 [Alnus glutinosa]|uniref:LOW QUALITY PROTEIN: phosphoglycerate mutase-like protein 1 n=1 Tax=Alnus glutinosa TaxID=3517 RepID=UPI002D792F80|nr:LOW QUALITY PROTEIN: phosphoglycerate mutase-like protein 1 [Alnus glutinosa]
MSISLVNISPVRNDGSGNFLRYLPSSACVLHRSQSQSQSQFQSYPLRSRLSALCFSSPPGNLFSCRYGWWWRSKFVSIAPMQNSSSGHSRLPSFLAFARNSRHCGLLKPYIQVRHAQGIHNVDGDKSYKAYLRPEYFDAHLTPLGWEQIDNLRKHVHASGLSKRIELVITSPLMRTIQTAVGVFGGEGYTDRMDVLPLMVANAGNSGRAAISSLNCPPIAAVELCREHLGVHPCDRRRNISDYQFLFPAVDFSLIETDEDILWKADIRETKEEVASRGLKFMNWLWTRKEKEIAIVTHSGLLFHTLSSFGNDCHPVVKSEICKHFANCELRSMVIVDRGMIGSDESTTNYPGKIPSGPDLPSDVDEKELGKEGSDSGFT